MLHNHSELLIGLFFKQGTEQFFNHLTAHFFLIQRKNDKAAH